MKKNLLSAYRAGEVGDFDWEDGKNLTTHVWNKKKSKN